MLRFYRKKSDYLKFEGGDRLDLINRLSTNKVNSLEKFKKAGTVLTSDKGRIVDLITLYNFGDFVFATCSFNNAKNVIDHLDKYTIMDDFKVTNMTGTHETLFLMGRDAETFTSDVFEADVSNAKKNDFKVFVENGKDSLVTGNEDPTGGVIFIYSTEDRDYWNRKLLSDSTFKPAEMSDEEYECERILAGAAEYGKEMSSLTNPLECGLNEYVSFTKGCYIGQEVIARLDAYDKISKHMVGLRSSNSFSVSENPGETKIHLNGNECGFATSATRSDQYGFIGLGFVKTDLLDYAKEYQIKNEDKLIDCKIAKLPFER